MVIANVKRSISTALPARHERSSVFAADLIIRRQALGRFCGPEPPRSAVFALEFVRHAGIVTQVAMLGSVGRAVKRAAPAWQVQWQSTEEVGAVRCYRPKGAHNQVSRRGPLPSLHARPPAIFLPLRVHQRMCYGLVSEDAAWTCSKAAKESPS
jgi:hypothetical protein